MLLLSLFSLGWMNRTQLKTGDPYKDFGNFGLLDLVQALRWVQGNIEVFGGDKNNVTLAGQSAGARNVLAAMTSPMMEGISQKTLPISGGTTTSTPMEGEQAALKGLARILVTREGASDEAGALTVLQGYSDDELRTMLYSLTKCTQKKTSWGETRLHCKCSNI